MGTVRQSHSNHATIIDTKTTFCFTGHAMGSAETFTTALCIITFESFVHTDSVCVEYIISLGENNES